MTIMLMPAAPKSLLRQAPPHGLFASRPPRRVSRPSQPHRWVGHRDGPSKCGVNRARETARSTSDADTPSPRSCISLNPRCGNASGLRNMLATCRRLCPTCKAPERWQGDWITDPVESGNDLGEHCRILVRPLQRGDKPLNHIPPIVHPEVPRSICPLLPVGIGSQLVEQRFGFLGSESPGHDGSLSLRGSRTHRSGAERRNPVLPEHAARRHSADQIPGRRWNLEGSDRTAELLNGLRPGPPLVRPWPPHRCRRRSLLRRRECDPRGR